MLADVIAIQEIAANPTLFGKPTFLYLILSFLGGNVIASEGLEWRRHRRAAAPAFGNRNNVVWDETTRVCNEWFRTIEEGKVDPHIFNSDEITCRITLLILCGAAFGRRVPWPTVSNCDDPSLRFLQTLEGMFSHILYKAVLPDWLLNLPVPAFKATKQYFTQYDMEMKQMIEECRNEQANGNSRDDLFSALVSASDSSESKEASLSEEELVSNIYMFIIAGHETSAHSISSVLFLLALYPEHQLPLYEEAKEIFGDDPCPPFSCYSQLKWSPATIREALRLFPVVTGIPKVATADTFLNLHRVDDSNVPIPTRVSVPAGTSLIFDVPGAHYSEVNWKDPYTFLPSRFIDTKDYTWPRHAFLSFSPGPRSCLGKAFAMVESTLILSLILRRFEVLPPPDMVDTFKRRKGESEAERRERLYQATFLVTLSPDPRLRFALKRRM